MESVPAVVEKSGKLDTEKLPWSFTYATITRTDDRDPRLSPATGTATHTGYQSDDLNVDDH